jgi:Dihydrodipicolinate synthase/N-acetylneuraminate lyase
MIMTKLYGILPALVTPLHSDETLNAAALERLLERVYSAGAHGVYLCGNTGEGTSLPAEVRRQVAEVGVRNSPRGKQVVVHAGASSLAEARSLVQHAAKLGVAAVSSLPPAGASYPEMRTYYDALAASSDVPFLAYYFPGAGSQSLSGDQLAEICALPGVTGLKFTDYNLYVLSLLVRDGAILLNGRDEVLAAGLLFGAHGGIGSIYNWFPAGSSSCTSTHGPADGPRRAPSKTGSTI